MSDELLIKVGLDASDAIAAAEALPDSLERSARSKKFGDFTKGFTMITPGSVSQIGGTKDVADRRTAYELKLAQEAERKKQAAVEQTTNDSQKWMKQFGDELGQTLMRSITPAAIAAKAIEIGWGNVIRMVEGMIATGNAKLESGISYTNTRALEMFANVGTASNEEVRAMAANAQKVANAVVSGGPAASGAPGFAYFGMTDFERYRKEGVPMGELMINMAKRYKKEGGGQEYEAMATNVLGPNWRKLSALLALEANSKKPGEVMQRIENIPGMADQYVMAIRYRMKALEMTPGELMGGVPQGGPRQLLSNVTSLQAMGGGDILSAVARGPQDQIVDNTARTAAAVEKMADKAQNTGPAPTVLK